MSTYAIGDIQGCLKPLQKLLKKINFDPAQDQLWIAGDLVNRGPKSLATLRYLYSIRHCVTAVLGNHDLHLLAVAWGKKRSGPADTLNAILEAPDGPILIDWLRHRKLLHTDENLGYTMVHAGIPPIWTLEQAEAYAREVEAVLQSDYVEEFLGQMYGNKPNKWKNRYIGYDRLRLITNYLTRMRFCDAEGELELTNKSAPTGLQSEQFLPWFDHPNHLCGDTRIVFGHWAALEGQAEPEHITALDTGCVWGGCLSALRLEDGELVSVKCR
ncbi:symmetrical bis(5'-nucleosyl)-tetraphosphatase [Gilvimarinus sp. SDUM040013]|uniref:Bis(5'-nucleosyl)-tetraphosphatase, symmetrical n=1 Tax=Gilvimarinus gilvus TaxID=3058038 RepID=A0ABU4S079_9GAMM|nr:symmetrical bis(5'-nucleosyl)-tetraphosphatase [Gilvimarinus sp. SDUM040013]MDO3385265.1 symmetrical bis(5'-nucleosyl)-tetraphosphatase [Gilvimarinus sp. SDUM040013]MDX6849248.1 symmetrical bis(5'-nucleosyl)-tetraphosphatase [Gilvimarinus sp. SDUM040013]